MIQLSSCCSLKEPNYRDLKNAVLNRENIIYYKMLFVHTDKKATIGYVSTNELRSNLLYDKKYKNSNLDSLVSKMLKGEYAFPLDSLELSGRFEFSSYVTDCYMRQSFKSFLNCFTQSDKEGNEFMINHELTQQEKLTVIYFLYFNGYYTVYDDYEGRYFARKGIKKPVIEKVKVKVIE